MTDYLPYTLLDTTNPAFSSAHNSSPKYYQNVTMNITIDDVNPEYYTFYWNLSGTYVNDSLTRVPSSKVISTTKNITVVKGTYVCWKVNVNDSAGNSANSTETCFVVENTVPSVPILTYPEDGGVVSYTTSILLQYNSSDIDSDTITYKVYDGETDVLLYNGANTNYTLSVIPDIYYWYVSACDSSGCSDNSTTNIFSVAAKTPPGGTGGGIPLKVILNWSIKTDREGDSYQIFMAENEEKTKRIFLYNVGLSNIQIDLECNAVKGQIDICDYVTFDKERIEVLASPTIPTVTSVTINLPDIISEGRYAFNVVAIDRNDYKRRVSIEIIIGGGWGFIRDMVVGKHYLNLEWVSEDAKTIPIPNPVIWGLSGIIFFVIMNLLVLRNITHKTKISFITALVVTTLIAILII